VKDDELYLIHISECIGRIEAYVAGGKAAFMSSTLIQDAVLRNLQTLAESSQRLSDGFKDSHPNIPWRSLAGVRNILVHDYLGIDQEVVWSIIERDLAMLASAVQNAS